MASLALPAAPSRDRWRHLKKLRDLAGHAAAAAIAPHKASLRRLADMPLSVLGTAGIDFAAFHVTHALGWLVTGISLFLVEHMIADEEPGRRM